MATIPELLRDPRVLDGEDPEELPGEDLGDYEGDLEEASPEELEGEEGPVPEAGRPQKGKVKGKPHYSDLDKVMFALAYRLNDRKITRACKVAGIPRRTAADWISKPEWVLTEKKLDDILTRRRLDKAGMDIGEHFLSELEIRLKGALDRMFRELTAGLDRWERAPESKKPAVGSIMIPLGITLDKLYILMGVGKRKEIEMGSPFDRLKDSLADTPKRIANEAEVNIPAEMLSHIRASGNPGLDLESLDDKALQVALNGVDSLDSGI